MKKKENGFIETVRKINNQEELKKQERFEKKNDILREKYGQKNAEEKIEVLKLKQGVIDQSDAINSGGNTARSYTKTDKIKNFLYHNKWWLGIASFITIIAAFLIYDTLTTIHSDVRIMLLSDNDNLQIHKNQIHEFFNSYVIDYNEDDRNYTDIVFIPISYDKGKNIASGGNYENTLSNLSNQFQLGECMMLLADSAADYYIEPETTLENLEEYFPDCPYVEGHKFYLKDTEFAKMIGLKPDEIPDDLYIAVRKPAKNLSSDETNKTNYDNAMETLKTIVKDLNKK